jgi:cold shock CspA family protein
MKGEIISYDEEGKCGFIKGEDEEEYFFQKDLEDAEVEIGSEVKFETSEVDKGSDANNEEKIEE